MIHQVDTKEMSLIARLGSVRMFFGKCGNVRVCVDN